MSADIQCLTVNNVHVYGLAWGCDLYADGVMVAVLSNDGRGDQTILAPPPGNRSIGFWAVMERVTGFITQGKGDGVDEYAIELAAINLIGEEVR